MLSCSFSPALSPSVFLLHSLCLSASLAPALSSTQALFWLTGPAVKVSQERAPHPRPEWKLAQVAVRARPGKMKEGGGVGGGLGKRRLCVCTFGSVSMFAWLVRPDYPQPLGLCTFYLCYFFLLLQFHFHFHIFHAVQLTPKKRSDYIGYYSLFHGCKASIVLEANVIANSYTKCIEKCGRSHITRHLLQPIPDSSWVCCHCFLFKFQGLCFSLTFFSSLFLLPRL